MFFHVSCEGLPGQQVATVSANQPGEVPKTLSSKPYDIQNAPLCRDLQEKCLKVDLVSKKAQSNCRWMKSLKSATFQLIATRIKKSNPTRHPTQWGGRFSKRFCKHFSESCTGCWASTSAAMLPKQSKGNSQKFVYKTFYSTCLPHAVDICQG